MIFNKRTHNRVYPPLGSEALRSDPSIMRTTSLPTLSARNDLAGRKKCKVAIQYQMGFGTYKLSEYQDKHRLTPGPGCSYAV